MSGTTPTATGSSAILIPPPLAGEGRVGVLRRTQMRRLGMGKSQGSGARMIRTGLTRRRALASAAAFGTFAIIGRAQAAKPFKPADSLVEAARKEGKIV